jgi:hypothetical protein
MQCSEIRTNMIELIHSIINKEASNDWGTPMDIDRLPSNR